MADILNEIEGVEVRRAAKEATTAKRRTAKATGPRRSKLSKPMTPKEKRFVKGLTRAFKDMNDHIAGKKKLKTLDEFLNKL